MSARAYDIADPQGGRNRLRSGDPVRVTKGGRDKRGFAATFQWAAVDASGAVTAITVTGGRGYDPALRAIGQKAIVQWRTVVPSRVRRMQRAKAVA